jgi:pimeloyl-ACP methyl ester carboxylesterase
VNATQSENPNMLSHQDSGAGAPALVFVHGLACALEDWKPQVDVLAASHRCIAVDLPGHGESPANGPLGIDRFGSEVAKSVTALAATPAILIGHSMGCRVVLEAARRLGSDIAGVVLVDGSLRAAGDPETARRETRETIQAAGFSSYVGNLFQVMFTDASDATVREHIVERALRLDPEAGIELIADLSAWDSGRMDSVLDALSVPVLMIQSSGVDENRNRIPLKPGDSTPFVDRVCQRMARVRVEIVPDIGHFTMLEAPQRVTELVAEFARAATA